jgi:hypothetical protein
MIAGPEEVDTSHIVALAQRVKNLGEADHRLAEEVEKLRVMLDKRLPTEDELTNMREVLSNKAGREYLRKQFNRWGLGGLGLLGAIFVTRTYVSGFLSWLASVLK